MELVQGSRYYHHTYFWRKVALLCSGLKGMGAGVITSKSDISTLSNNTLERPLVLQKSIGSGDHFTSGGPSACLRSNDVKKESQSISFN